MKIAVGQINPTVGDLIGNSQKILKFCELAHEERAELIIFPELSLPGYPPKDLLLRKDFLYGQLKALDQVAKHSPLPTLLGAAIIEQEDRAPFNAAILCSDGKWEVVARKLLLPNYNVFDEKRYFSVPTANACSVLTFKGKKFLVSICEDAWANELVEGQKKYDIDPIASGVTKHGPVDAIINMMASPYTMSKPRIRQRIFTEHAKRHQTAVIVAGQVGANDQLLFDGQSMVIDQFGAVKALAQPCAEDIFFYHLNGPLIDASLNKPLADDDLLLEMLTVGIRDYVEKCQRPGVIVGVSGGIDSAVCLALAVRALGKHRVRAVFLPSQFTSEQSLIDAKLLTDNLSLKLQVIPIEEAVCKLRGLLAPDVNQSNYELADIFDQNLQSRIRGLMVMGLTNTCDYLMIATSNKSELAVGYSTIYGDMCGAFSAIGDLYKTKVWQLADTINKQQPTIPYSIINRPPTAELKHNQLDTDTLPDFHILDRILFNFIELEKSAQEIETITRLSRTLIDEVIKKVSIAEYKRRQGPFCLMVSDKVFGEARRLPIAKRMTELQ